MRFVTIMSDETTSVQHTQQAQQQTETSPCPTVAATKDASGAMPLDACPSQSSPPSLSEMVEGEPSSSIDASNEEADRQQPATSQGTLSHREPEPVMQ
jgi:hypothetical protein